MAMTQSASMKYVDIPLPSSASKLMCRVQFKHLWKYMAVRVPQNTPISNLTITDSHGVKCSIHLTWIKTVKLMPTN
jgi:hypothetical protein